MNHIHEPKHGLIRKIVDGKIQHIPLCPESCCPKEMPALTGASNVMPEVQSLLDILHRHIKDVDYRGHEHREKLSATEIALQASIDSAINKINRSTDLLYQHIKNESENAERQNAQLSARVFLLENRTLWDMVKRCFTH